MGQDNSASIPNYYTICYATHKKDSLQININDPEDVLDTLYSLAEDRAIITKVTEDSITKEDWKKEVTSGETELGFPDWKRRKEEN